MTKSKLIERLINHKANLLSKNVEDTVKNIIEYMSIKIANNERIEIRGFGSFSLHYRASRIGRNPKTGNAIILTEKYVPYFKPGKELRKRINIVSLKNI
ncbi:Integration host factor subunit beta [Candidatus Profftia lariciata]|uniref:integration host factor subunit beta n=1 Tax=Candidatus Profftia lariciata TaxID=1987921 RepID=UPI001D006046|nr:integration host factor subunit beta [Candidatus Profftia lariciata]UDG81463.1 Integration host factor subunit beta [Candidatus Profftia lariciata]